MINQETALNALLVVLSITLVFGGLEVALQLDLLTTHDTQHKYCEGPIDRYQSHPKYGYIEHPNSVYFEKRTGNQPWELFAHNKEGFRDTYNRGNDNILVLGDSFTRGTLTTQNNTYPHLLDRWNTNTSFRNYGLGGSGQNNQLQIYQNVSKQYDHDLVVLGYYMNDPFDNYRNTSRNPEYKLSNGKLELVSLPETESDQSGVPIHRQVYFKTPLKYFETPQYLFGKWNNLNRKLDGKKGLEEPPTGKKLENRLSLTSALISEIGSQAATHDAEVLVVVIPSRGEVNPDRPVRFPIDDGQPYRDANREMIRELAANDSNISMLNPLQALKEKRNNGHRVYGIKDAHLDDKGYRVLAKDIQERLMNRGYVQGENVNYSKHYSSNPKKCSHLQ